MLAEIKETLKYRRLKEMADVSRTTSGMQFVVHENIMFWFQYHWGMLHIYCTPKLYNYMYADYFPRLGVVNKWIELFTYALDCSSAIEIGGTLLFLTLSLLLTFFHQIRTKNVIFLLALNDHIHVILNRLDKLSLFHFVHIVEKISLYN